MDGRLADGWVDDQWINERMVRRLNGFMFIVFMDI